MAASYLPLAAALLATAITLLAATSAVPVAAAAHKYSGRMVIIRAPGATVVSAGGALSKRQQQRRLVEDEVAPEFGGGYLLAGADKHINNNGLDPDSPVCLHNACAARGAPYIGRQCSPAYRCPNHPPAEHASRAVHV